jgi:hypothetical protein
MIENDNWVEEEEQTIDDEFQVGEYDLTSSPNDFNTATIVNFIESGAVKIPAFQRNYVWDLKRASKLIESLVIGLPVPQIFLYEEGRNSFLVIDGQQRLMSIFYFVKGRFPRKDKRPEIRRIFDAEGGIPPKVFEDDKYFSKFNLDLPSPLPDKPNQFHGLNYGTLDDFQKSFDLRTIRNVIVKQNVPKDDDSSIYEIFNRLNTGGVNLKAQEIRTSLYHSDFYQMLYRCNILPGWRQLVGVPEPDLHMQDVEILLRGFALLVDGDAYVPSMTKFLNKFSKAAKKFPKDKIDYYEGLFGAFVAAAKDLSKTAFVGGSGRFSAPVFESIFVAAARGSLAKGTVDIAHLDPARVAKLRSDPEFITMSQKATTNSKNVAGRIARANAILFG